MTPSSSGGRIPSSALSARRASILRRSSARSGNSSAYSSSKRFSTSTRRKRGSIATCGASATGGGVSSERGPGASGSGTATGRLRRKEISFFQIDSGADTSDLRQPQLAPKGRRKRRRAPLDQTHQLRAPARARDGRVHRHGAVKDER